MLINGDKEKKKRNKLWAHSGTGERRCNINEVLFINLVSVKTDCCRVPVISSRFYFFLMKFYEDFNSTSEWHFLCVHQHEMVMRRISDKFCVNKFAYKFFDEFT